MAKKSKKAAPQRAAKRGKAKAAKSTTRWTSGRGEERAKQAKSATQTPKQIPLVKGLRIRALDNICGHISDTRAAIARLQGEEADLELKAHALLQEHKQQTWEHAGVALIRKPGVETMIVKTVRNRPPAAAAQPENGDEAPAPEGESETTEGSSSTGTGGTVDRNATDTELDDAAGKVTH